jgi:cation:H+ antiporter
MSSLVAVVLLAAGVGLVVGGAELFFDGLMASAHRLRTSPFVLAALVSGLELENLAAGIAANAKGLPGAAAGTFLGGTTFLALAVSGLAAVIAPIRAQLPGRVIVWTLAAPLPLVALSLDGELSRLDGGVLVAWFCVAMIGIVRSGRSIAGEAPSARRRGALVRLVAGLGVLTAGGELLGDGIRRTVSSFDVSQTLLGNTVVAASVEGEEVARSVVPSRRGRGDIAIANVAGTIVHFVALNAGVIALVRPLSLDQDTLRLHTPVAAASTVILCALLWSRRGISRRAGAALLAAYVVYVAAAVAVGV